MFSIAASKALFKRRRELLEYFNQKVNINGKQKILLPKFCSEQKVKRSLILPASLEVHVFEGHRNPNRLFRLL